MGQEVQINNQNHNDKEVKWLSIINKFTKILSSISQLVKDGYRSEIVRISAVIVSLILIALYTFPKLLNTKGLHFILEQKISTITHANFKINGEVKLAMLPRPNITITNANLDNYRYQSNICNLKVNHLKIFLPFFHSETNHLDSIQLKESAFECYKENAKPSHIITANENNTANKNNLQPLDSNQISAKIFNINSLDEIKLGYDKFKIIIENGTANFYNEKLQNKKIERINLKALENINNIVLGGEFDINGINHKINTVVNFNNKGSSFNISSEDYNIELIGDLKGERAKISQASFDGKASFAVNNLKNFYRSLFYRDTIYNKLQSNNQPLNLNATVKVNNKTIKIDQILVNSSLINGSGNIIVDFNYKTPAIDLNFSLENLRLTDIWSIEPVKLIGSQLSTKDREAPTSNTASPINEGDEGEQEKPSNSTANNLNLANSTLANNDKAVATNNSANNNSQNNQNDANQAKPETKAEQNKDHNPETDNYSFLNEYREKKFAYHDYMLEINKIAKKNNHKKSFDLTADITIKNITYFNAAIKDFEIYFTLSPNSELSILPMTFKIPGDGLVRFIGFLDNKQVSPVLVGNLDSFGNDFGSLLNLLQIDSKIFNKNILKKYQLSSGLLMLPDSAVLDNFYLSLNDSQLNLIGEIKLDHTNSNKKLIADLKIDNFDYQEHLSALDYQSYTAPGKLLKKLIWLNEVETSYDLKLSFEKMLFNQNLFVNSKLNLIFGNGQLGLRQFNLQNDQYNVFGDMIIDISKKQPELSINVKANEIDVGKLLTADYQPLSVDKSETAEKNNIFKEQSQLVGSNEDAEKNKESNNDLLDKVLSFASLDGFSGKIDIAIEKMFLKDLLIENFITSGQLKEGVVDIKNMGFKAFDGLFTYNGSVGMRFQKSISGNIEGKKANIGKMISHFSGNNNIDAIANLSTSISFSASNVKEFKKDLNVNVKFNAVKPVVKGYGLNKIINAVANSQQNYQILQNIDDTLFDTNQYTSFKNADGHIIINKEEAKFRFNLANTGVSGIFSGKQNINNDTMGAVANIIFFTGAKNKLVPINLATSIAVNNKGTITLNGNYNQIYQYLNITPAKGKSGTADVDANISNIAIQ